MVLNYFIYRFYFPSRWQGGKTGKYFISSSTLLFCLLGFLPLNQVSSQVDEPSLNCVTGVAILPTDTVTCRFPRPSLIVTGDSSFDYRWLNENSDQIGSGQELPLTTGGNYQLIVSDLANNCSDTLFTDVATDQREPIFTFSSIPSFTCTQNQVTVEALIPGFDNDSLLIEWRTQGGMLIGNTPEHLISDDQPYVAVVRNTTNGCGSRDTVQITYDTITPQPVINQPAGLIIDCNADSLLFFTASSEDELTYEWTNTSGDMLSILDSVIVTTPGQLTLTTTDQETGCWGEQSFNIEFHEFRLGEVIVNYPDCSATENASLRINSIIGEGNYQLRIDDLGINLGETIYLASGTSYTLTALSENNCSSQFLVNVPTYQPITTAIITNQASFLVGDSIFAQTELADTSTVRVDWFNNGDLVCEDCLAYQTVARQNFILKARLTDEFGCAVNVSRPIFVAETAPIYLPSAFSPNSDGTNDYLKVFIGDRILSINEMSCYDRWGNQVFYSNDETQLLTGWDGNFRGELLPSGTYVVNVTYTTIDEVKRRITKTINLIR